MNGSERTERRPRSRRHAPPVPAATRARDTVARLAPALGPGMARVPVTAGPAGGLPHGRPAATMWDELVFGSAGPPAEQVAHELVHAAQARRFGPAPAGTGTAPPDAADEREARMLTPAVLLGEPVTVTQAPTAPLRLWTPDDDQQRPGADELRKATDRHDAERVIEILAANREREHMAALRAEYGRDFIEHVHGALTIGREKTLWSLALVYLGDQISLDERIRVEDRVFGGDEAKILAQIDALTDEQALRMVAGEQQFPGLTEVPPPGVTPAQAPLENVQAALKDALDSDGYYRAMQLLLRKAGRAHGRRWADTGTWTVIRQSPTVQLTPGVGEPIALTGVVGPVNLGVHGFFDPEDILATPPLEDAGGEHDLVFVDLLDNPASTLRIGMAVDMVVRADEHREFGLIVRERQPLLGSAMLALGVLSYAERRAAWGRLRERSWAGFDKDQVELLRRLALFHDDALVLERAAMEAAKDPVHHEAQLAVAAATAESLLDEARHGAAVAKDPGLRAEFEAQLHKRRTVFSSPGFQSAIGATGEYATHLAALGADPLRIAMQSLRSVDSAEGLFQVVKEVPPKSRGEEGFPGLVRRKAERLELSAAQRETLEAYLGLAADDKGGTNFKRVALHEMMTAFDDKAPHRALGLMHRMTPAQRDGFVAWEPYRQWHKGLINRGHAGRYLWSWLNDANAGRTVEALRSAALWTEWWKPEAKPKLWHLGAYEEWLAASGGDRAARRRGFALWTEKQANKDLALDAEDQKLVDAYEEHQRLTKDKSWSERERVDEVWFGQPQLYTSAEGAVDPTTEADYMFARVAGRRKLKTSWRTVVDDIRQWRGTYLGPAVTEFLLTYGDLRTGGIDQADLAVLADLYHRAMRETDELKREADLAGIVASIVGCVVAICVVMILSAGTLGPVAIGAIAALAGGTAAATAGALIRQESTGLEVLRDFGTGAVEGAMAVAGSAIAARAVRALSAGSAAVEAGAAAGGAVKAATGASTAARIAGAVVDGAVSGAAGEVFRTATDEATWDRSTSEALSRVLAAIGRGAVMGGAGGFAIAGGISALAGLARVTRRFGQAVATGVADLLEGSKVPLQRLDDLSEPAVEALVEAQRLAARGDIDGALDAVKKVQQAGQLTAAEALEVERTLRAVRIAEATLEPGLDRAEVLRRLEEVSEAEFARRAHGARGNALIEFGADGPRVVVKAGTDPLAVAEEVQHLRQWAGDPLMRARMERISRQTAESWAELPAVERAGLYLDKLEVEADAQRRIIAQLEHRAAGGDAEAADRIAAAEDTLDALGKRIDTVTDAIDDVARGAGPKRLEALDLRRPPQMFSKERPVRSADPRTAPNWRSVEKSGVLKENPDKDPDRTATKLRELGYDVERDRAGQIVKIRAKAGKRLTGEVAQLTIEESATGARRIVPGTPRATWEERQADAARNFRRMRRDLARLKDEIALGKLTEAELTKANEALARLNPRFLAELERRVTAGTLSEGGAGLLAPWGGYVADLRARTGLSFAELLEPIGKTAGKLPEASYDEFRRSLRRLGAEQLNAIRPGPNRRAALDTMLALQPDSRSKGELYTAYLRKGRGPAGPVHKLEVPFEPPLRGDARQPDDVADAADLGTDLSPGLYAAEHKAGPDAFKVDQAEEYARALLRKGGPVTTAGQNPDWEGIVYTFSHIDDAKAALRKLESGQYTQKVLGRRRLGIHVLYTDHRGQLQRLSSFKDVVR